MSADSDRDLEELVDGTSRTRLDRIRGFGSDPTRDIGLVGNVLVISTVEHSEDMLRSHVGEADKLKVVVPVVRQSFLDWLANDEKAFSRAKSVAEDTAAELPGETIEAVAGEADVDLAIRDALATFPADEIVVAVRPDAQQGHMESLGTASAPTHAFEGIPVRFLVIPDQSESATSPAKRPESRDATSRDPR